MRQQKYIFAVLILIVISSILLYPLFNKEVGLIQIRQNVEMLGLWGPLVFIIFYAVASIFIPSTPFMALAGVLFGFKYGFLCVTIGGFMGAIITFYISRKLGKPWAERMLQHKYLILIERYNRRLESGAVWDLIAMRLAPMPFNVLNILMGISRISTRDYIIGTLLGLIPSNVLAVYFGSFLTLLF